MAANVGNEHSSCGDRLLPDLFSVATYAFKAGQSRLVTCVYFAVLRLVGINSNAREVYRTLRYVNLLLVTIGTEDEIHYVRSLATTIFTFLLENERNAQWTSVSRERKRFAELVSEYLQQDLKHQVKSSCASKGGLTSWERVQLIRAVFVSKAAHNHCNENIPAYCCNRVFLGMHPGV